jgi:hypothetical protein
MSATVRTVLGISNLAAPRPALEIVNADVYALALGCLTLCARVERRLEIWAANAAVWGCNRGNIPGCFEPVGGHRR